MRSKVNSTLAVIAPLGLILSGQVPAQAAAVSEHETTPNEVFLHKTGDEFSSKDTARGGQVRVNHKDDEVQLTTKRPKSLARVNYQFRLPKDAYDVQYAVDYSVEAPESNLGTGIDRSSRGLDAYVMIEGGPYGRTVFAIYVQFTVDR